MTEDFHIIKGAHYRYLPTHPPGCQGKVYQVEDFVVHVPSYQHLVLVLALTGPDRGKRFCCSESNFASRYEPLEIPAVAEALPERVAGRLQTGSGA